MRHFVPPRILYLFGPIPWAIPRRCCLHPVSSYPSFSPVRTERVGRRHSSPPSDTDWVRTPDTMNIPEPLEGVESVPEFP